MEGTISHRMSTMLAREYEGENCSAARALEVIGERWSMLIIRESMIVGITRFRDFQRRLGMASNVLKNRLDGFVADGIMERHRISDTSDWPEYILTDKGRDLWSIHLALTTWGDRWAAPAGPPVIFTHADCGGDIEQQPALCTKCGQTHPTASDIATRPGPGATPAPEATAAGKAG